MSDSNSIISYVAIALSVGTAIIGAVNHKRVRSTCCGSKAEVSLDIESTSPPRLMDTTDKSHSSAVS